MDVLFASIVAVAGTLLGSAATYIFQRLNAGRAEAFARNEQRRQERLAAYSAFASAITELRTAVIAVWFRQHRAHRDADDAHRDADDVAALRAEANRLGAAADHARFRVQLLSRDPGLVSCADAAFEPIDAIYGAADLPEARVYETRCQEILGQFITAAGDEVR